MKHLQHILFLTLFFLLLQKPLYAKQNDKELRLEFAQWVQKMSQLPGLPWMMKSSIEIDLSKSESNYDFLNDCAGDKFVILNGNISNDERLHNFQINGSGIIEYHDDSECYNELGIDQIDATWIAGKIEGMAKISFQHGNGFLIANFKNGFMHGLARRFRCKFGDCEYFKYKPWSIPTYLSSVANYINGKAIGPIWKFKIGGGLIYGLADSKSEVITDKNGVYIYSDKKTALVGSFEKDEMKETRLEELIGWTYNDQHFIVPITTRNNKDGPIFKYEPSNNTYIPNPLLRDPYEIKYLFVDNSTIEEAGRGVFVREDIPHPGTLLGFYNGVRMSHLESKLINKATRRSSYRMDNDWANPTQILNIPVEYRNLDQYNATVAHLINHSDDPNAWFAMIDHPRFGKVRSIISAKPLKSGDELFIDYGFIKRYQESEEMIHTLLKAGQWISGKNDPKEYHNVLKYHVHYLREKINDIKPYLDKAKDIYDLLLNN